MGTFTLQLILNSLRQASVPFLQVVFRNSSRRLLKDIQSFSFDVGCHLFCSPLRSHTSSIMLRSELWGSQSMTDSVHFALAVNACFSSHGNVFGMFVMLKNEAAASKVFSRWHWMVEQNLMGLSLFLS